MREQIINFATNIIFNGVSSNLKYEKIEEGLITYIKYLKTQDFADEETLNILKTVVTTLPELIKLARVHKSSFVTSVILNMYTEKYNKQIIEKQKANDRCGSTIISTVNMCGNSKNNATPDRIKSQKERNENSNVVNTKITDSCGSGRSRTRSSC